MATGLDANFQLGDSSASSLVKSAASLENELSTYSDDEADITYENSDKTDSDFATYQAYWSSRINQLQSTGSVTDATKALTASQKIVSGQKSNISANVQRDTISVMDGTGTNEEKLADIQAGYSQLVSIGDDAGAQTLEDQAYSLSQTIQLDAQNAATAAAALEDANATSINEYVTKIQNTISSNNAAFAAQGEKYLSAGTATYLKSIGLKTTGVATITSAVAGAVGMVNKGVTLDDTSKYAQGTYTAGSILDSYTQAIALDPSKTQTYQDDINGYLNGTTSVKVGGASMSYNSLMNTVYATNTEAAPYSTVQNADGSYQIKADAVTGYVWGKDQNGTGKLMPTYSLFTPTIPSQTVNAFKDAGINIKSDSNGVYYFQATDKSSWLGKVIGNNPTAGVVQANGSVEFAVNGQFMAMVNVNGKYGVQQIGQNGKISNDNVAGQYGFTPTQKATADASRTNSISIAGGSKAFTNPDTIMIGGKPASDTTSQPKNNTVGITGKSSYIPGLGNGHVSNILADAQNLSRINAAHYQTMQATAPPVFTPTPITVTPNTAPAPTVSLNTNAAKLSQPVGTGPVAGSKQLNQNAVGTQPTIGTGNVSGGNSLNSSGGGISLGGSK